MKISQPHRGVMSVAKEKEKHFKRCRCAMSIEDRGAKEQWNKGAMEQGSKKGKTNTEQGNKEQGSKKGITNTEQGSNGTRK